MLAVCFLTFAELMNTAEAASLPQNGKITFSGYHYSSQIYAVEPDGSNLRTLTNFDGRFPVGASWSPDGTTMAIGYDEEISFLDADGSELRSLPTHPNRFGDGEDTGTTWSPDGTRLTFTYEKAAPRDTSDIYTMDLDGSNRINLTNSPNIEELHPDVSPDGSQICLSRRITRPVPSGETELWLMDADGSNLTLLTEDAYDPHCDWSPDGKKIIFEAEGPRSHDVYVINTDGSGRTNLTDDSELDIDPAWSPDGKKIAFASYRAGSSNDIYTMDADGSGVARVTKTPDVDDRAPEWQPLPPKSGSVTVHPPDTGGLSLLLLAGALLFSGGVMLYAGVKLRM
jgi:TolB protein